MIKYKSLIIDPKNAPIIADIVCQTYQAFNAKEGKKEALNQFLFQYDNQNHSADELAERFKKSDINFGAFSEDKMVGIIRGKKNRIINLFVDGDFHHLGIGKKLIILFETQAKKEGSEFIKIRSSLYAAEFYAKCDYKKTTGIRSFHGLKIQPLKKDLK
ncbi:MAG: GNAT family N-acetyltransferase [Candidatus Falkowbacteria bacterium]